MSEQLKIGVTKHSPLPWVAVCPPSSCLTSRFVEGANGEHICKIGHMDYTSGSQGSDLANVEFLVRAVNCHDELVAALHLASACLARLAAQLSCVKNMVSIGDLIQNIAAYDLTETSTQIQAAIAKAKGIER